MSDKIRAQFWGSQLEGVMKEIAREAAICQVRLLDPGVIEAYLGSVNDVASLQRAPGGGDPRQRPTSPRSSS